MRAWAVGPARARSTAGRWWPSSVRCPSRDRARCGCAVSACGVCRTDLHLAEGDLVPRRAGVVPGHEVVGRVDRVGPGCALLGRGGPGRGARGWPAPAGRCRFCRAGAENLCTDPVFTGWDVDGGYAEYAVVDERYAYRLPDALGDLEAAPLLCAGIIGYRALRRAELPPGGRLGDLRVRRSAHLTAQVALAEGATRPRHDPLGGGPATRARPRCGQRPGCRRPAARAARRRHPLRPGGHAGAAGPRGPRPGRHPRRGRHPPLRHPATRLRPPPVRGADAAQRHGQHPDRRASSSWSSPAASASGCPPCPTPSTQADRALADLAHDRVDGAAVLVVGGG